MAGVCRRFVGRLAFLNSLMKGFGRLGVSLFTWATSWRDCVTVDTIEFGPMSFCNPMVDSLICLSTVLLIALTVQISLPLLKWLYSLGLELWVWFNTPVDRALITELPEDVTDKQILEGLMKGSTFRPIGLESLPSYMLVNIWYSI